MKKMLKSNKYFTVLKAKENEPDMYIIKLNDNNTLTAEVFPKEMKNEINYDKYHRYNNINIVNLKQNLTLKEDLYILMDYCNEGSLDNFKKIYYKITNKDITYINEAIIQKILNQIFKGLEYLHSKKIIHGFLSCSNIWINYDKNKNEKNKSVKEDLFIDKINLKIKYLFSKRDKERCCKNIDIMKYMAPEILEKIINNNYDYNPDSDLVDSWSLGVILYKLLIGKYPFEKEDQILLTPTQLLNIIKDGEITYPSNKYISIEIIKLINNLLKIDPKERLTLEQIKKDDFYLKEPKNFTFIDFEKDTKILLNCSDDYIKWILLKDTGIKIKELNEKEKLKFLIHETDTKIIENYNRINIIYKKQSELQIGDAKKNIKIDFSKEFYDELNEINNEIDELTNQKQKYEIQLKNLQKVN